MRGGARGTAVVLMLLVVGVVVAAAGPRAPTVVHQVTTQATPSERFDLAHDALHDLAIDYSSDVLKTIASLLLVMGWLMMSEATRNFLRQSTTARRTALVVVPVVAVANTVWLWDRFKTSQALVDLLNTLGYVPEAYYADDRITVTLWITNLVLHLALFAAFFALVYSQKHGHIGESLR